MTRTETIKGVDHTITVNQAHPYAGLVSAHMAHRDAVRRGDTRDQHKTLAAYQAVRHDLLAGRV